MMFYRPDTLSSDPKVQFQPAILAIPSLLITQQSQKTISLGFTPHIPISPYNIGGDATPGF